MSSLFSSPKIPAPDTSALKAAQEAQRKAKEAEALASAQKRAAEDANNTRKKNVATSGRASTVLAGETTDKTTLLGR